MPPSSKLIHRCAVRSWMSAAAAISVAFSFNGHKPITSNQSRGLNLLSSKIELVQSVNMANCWPERAAQGTQLKRCRPLSQVISSFLVILQVWYQVFHQVAPTGFEQPHYTNTAWVKLL